MAREFISSSAFEEAEGERFRIRSISEVTEELRVLGLIHGSRVDTRPASKGGMVIAKGEGGFG